MNNCNNYYLKNQNIHKYITPINRNNHKKTPSHSEGIKIMLKFAEIKRL